MRVVSQYIASEKNAGPKAKIDIERILNKQYNAKIFTNRVKMSKERSLFSKIKKVIFSCIALNTRDIVVVQIPFTYKTKLLRLAKNKIGLIHDLDGIRFKDNDLLKKEIQDLNEYKVIIVHNNRMKEALIKGGVTTKMIELEMFDYLLNENANRKSEQLQQHKKTIIYPGSLEPRKAEFLYALKEEKMNFNINAYGPDYKENSNSKISYKGSFEPDVLPYRLEGDFGLVWSGKIDSSDEDEGEKRYNKFNAPHKLSCFIAAGLPIITWEKSAIADIIDKYNIGYKINNLYEINDIDMGDYAEKKKNVEELSKKVISGYFTIKAVDEAIREVKKNMK